ncbi:MAG: hypothetical protein ACT4QG_00445 [Sporichthyaceae bacterium]
MRRRLLVAVPVGLMLFAGCGETQLGAAAVVGGERIPLSEIQDTVAQTKAFLDAQGVLVRGEGPTAAGEVERRVIELIVARTAADVGVTATDTEVAAFAAEQSKDLGGQSRMLQAFAAQGINPDRVSSVFRTETLLRKISAKLVGTQNLSEAEGVRRLQQKLVSVADAMGIRINPRYGTFGGAEGPIVQKLPDYIKAAKP